MAAVNMETEEVQKDQDEKQSVSKDKTFPFFDQLPVHLIDKIIVKMERESYFRLRRASKGFEEHIRRHRCRLPAVHTGRTLTIDEIKIKNDLRISLTYYEDEFAEDIKHCVELPWEERWELMDLEYIRRLVVEEVSDSIVLEHLVPFLNIVHLSVGVLSIDGPKNDAFLQLINSMYSDSLGAQGKIEELYVDNFVKRWQSLPALDYGRSRKIGFDLSEDITDDFVLNTILKGVQYTKVWDDGMHSESALQAWTREQTNEVGETIKAVYMIKTDPSKCVVCPDQCYGILMIYRWNFYFKVLMKDVDFVVKFAEVVFDDPYDYLDEIKQDMRVDLIPF